MAAAHPTTAAVYPRLAQDYQLLVRLDELEAGGGCLLLQLLLLHAILGTLLACCAYSTVKCKNDQLSCTCAWFKQRTLPTGWVPSAPASPLPVAPPTGAASQPEPAPPLPEDQLAQLPVHVHRTPTKKGRQMGGSTGFTPSSTPRKSLFPSPSGKGSGGAAAGREPAAPPGCVPVLVEQAAGGVHAAQQLQLGSAQPPRPAGWAASAKVGAAAAATAAADAANGGGIKAARPAAPAAPGELGQEIVPAAAPLDSEGSEGEEDDPLCSVCLEPFADGAKVRTRCGRRRVVQLVCGSRLQARLQVRAL